MIAKERLPKIEWQTAKDDEKALEYIVDLAILLRHLRGVVITYESNDSQGADYSYALPKLEEPDRAMVQLKNLARGHALSLGRNYITVDDIPIVVKVVLSTAVIERVSIFDLLLANKGKLTTSLITAALNTSNPTAKRTMAEFKALGLVTMTRVDPEKSNSEMQILLKEDFKWFLTEEFEKLREGYEPGDFKEFLEQSKKKQSDAEKNNGVHGGKISFSKNDNLFRDIYTSLEKAALDGIVGGTKLKQELTTSGLFDASESQAALDGAVSAGLLAKVEHDLYKRKEGR
jgi:hypothetical protein